MMKNWLAAGAVALTVGMTSTIAQAQTTTVPGEQVGLATGAPLPEGIYAINTFIYRRTDSRIRSPTRPSTSRSWSGRPRSCRSAAASSCSSPPRPCSPSPATAAGVRNKDISINVGTFVGGIWAFDLGNNFGVSLLGGAYLNDLNGDRGSLITASAATRPATPVLVPQLSSNTYRFGVAGSYTGDGWNITANLTANIYDSPGRFGGHGRRRHRPAPHLRRPELRPHRDEEVRQLRDRRRSPTAPTTSTSASPARQPATAAASPSAASSATTSRSSPCRPTSPATSSPARRSPRRRSAAPAATTPPTAGSA